MSNKLIQTKSLERFYYQDKILSKRGKDLQNKILRQVAKAIQEYKLIQEGDKVLVCLSGGKDSYAMLDILYLLQKRAPIHFEIKAVHLDQVQPGHNPIELQNFVYDVYGIQMELVTKDTYSIVKEKTQLGKSYCTLCSRLRRGILYQYAKSINANKIALGHHAMDAIETLFMNMFHGSRMKAMPAKLISDDEQNILIRPMIFCQERQLELYAQHRNFPILPCNLCGSQPSERKRIKQMLHDWEKNQPGILDNMIKSLANVTASHLLDNQLYPFKTLTQKINLDKSNE